MKKSALSICCVLFASAATFAQADSTTAKVPVRRTESEFTRPGWTRLRHEELPETVRTTLNANDHYKGWERFPVFKNQSTNRYGVSVDQGSGPQNFYFDPTGKLIEGRKP